MASIFIKGIALVTKDMFHKDKTCLGLYLLCVMNPWERVNFGQTATLLIDHPEAVKRKYGEVRSTLDAFQNDIHNLSIGYHQMKRVMGSKMEDGLKILYLGNLAENYITNIRSIYDHMAIFSRIALEHEHLKSGKGCQESLNSLIKTIRKNPEHYQHIFGNNIADTILAMEKPLQTIKSIRDTIIHDGKEAMITFSDGKPHIKIIKSNFNREQNLLPDLLGLGNAPYPLFPYLQLLTRQVLADTDNLGTALAEHFIKKDPDYPLELVALVGICIKDFVNFIIRDIKL